MQGANPEEETTTISYLIRTWILSQRQWELVNNLKEWVIICSQSLNWSDSCEDDCLNLFKLLAVIKCMNYIIYNKEKFLSHSPKRLGSLTSSQVNVRFRPMFSWRALLKRFSHDRKSSKLLMTSLTNVLITCRSVCHQGLLNSLIHPLPDTSPWRLGFYTLIWGEKIFRQWQLIWKKPRNGEMMKAPKKSSY